MELAIYKHLASQELAPSRLMDRGPKDFRFDSSVSQILQISIAPALRFQDTLFFISYPAEAT
jgi:hypothetical protein